MRCSPATRTATGIWLPENELQLRSGTIRDTGTNTADAILDYARGGLQSGHKVDGNTPATGAPAITGTAQVGQTLSAGPGDIADGNGIDNAVFGYQWVRVDGMAEMDISGETADTYKLVAVDVGKTLKVRASFTDDVGHNEARTSAATAAVTPVPVTIEAEHTSIGGGLEDLVYTLTRAGDTADALSVTVTLTQDETWLTAANLSHTVTFNAGEAEKGADHPRRGLLPRSHHQRRPDRHGERRRRRRRLGGRRGHLHRPRTRHHRLRQERLQLPGGRRCGGGRHLPDRDRRRRLPAPARGEFGPASAVCHIRGHGHSVSRRLMAWSLLRSRCQSQPSDFTTNADEQQVARILFGPSGR